MNKISPLTGLVCILAITLLNGCTLIGLGVGAIADSASSDENLVSTDKVKTIGKGDTCHVFLWNNDEVVGAFNGIERLPKEQYQQRYSDALRKLYSAVSLPSLGDTIDLRLPDSKKILRGAFLGVDRKHVELKKTGKPDPSKVSCDDIARITGINGRYVEGDSLRSLISKGQLPLLSAITVSNEKGIHKIPLDDISRIVVIKGTKYWLTGLLSGAVIDGAVLIIGSSVDLDLGGLDFGR
jgi:hypothetical protein